MKKEKIVHLLTSDRQSGGNIYERYLQESSLGIQPEFLIKAGVKNRLKKFFYFCYALYNVSQKEYTTVIRKSEATFCLSRAQRNIIVFHHYHPAPTNIPVNLFQRIAHRNLLRNLNQVDTIVVVSRHWYEYFKKLGASRIKIIYNPFEIKSYYRRDEQEIARFKAKYELDNKPIVYIGNPQKSKGADKTYEALKSLDVHLVTSGAGELSLPSLHLNLAFSEYILLLQASSLSVLMSQIEEGWNRVAHESILCGTPVIGTGFGGMGELLEESGQAVCQDFERLPELVERMLQDNVEVTQSALKYVESFSLERFYKAWEKILY